MYPEPFTSDVLSWNVIPESYFGKDTNRPSCQWFSSTPKFTTVRVNTLMYTPEHVVDFVEAQTNRSVDVSVHPSLSDCVVIGSNPPTLSDDLSDIDVIVDVPCAEAVLRGAHVFAPAVLGLPSGTKTPTTVRIFADIDRKCKRGLSQPFHGNKYFIGLGILKMCRHDLFDNNIQPKGVAVEVTSVISGVPNISIPPEMGLLQNLPSILTSHLLDVNESHIVLDMCAAPGNKTTHIATIMNNKVESAKNDESAGKLLCQHIGKDVNNLKGKVIAVDKNQTKIDKIKSKCDQFGLTNVDAYVWDSTKAVRLDETSDSSPVMSPPFLPNTFDRILLDTPCSALGQRPQLRNSVTLAQVKSYPPLQKKLFSNAATLLKPGGVLIYCTCTITIQENEGLVSWALDKFPFLSLCPTTPYLGKSGVSWENHLSDSQLNMVQRFSPCDSDSPESDTIGFFVAKFVKS